MEHALPNTKNKYIFPLVHLCVSHQFSLSEETSTPALLHELPKPAEV